MGNRDRLGESDSKRRRDERDGDFPIGKLQKEQTKR
jgi:hypothetical protein